MTLIDGNVIKTKSGIFTRYDNDVGLFVFSPYTGLIYGIHNDECKKIYKWLENEDECVDEKYINSLGLGFAKSIENAVFGTHRLLPDFQKWVDASFLSRPLVINWLITGKCTHNCKYCYASDLMGDDSLEPNEESVIEIAAAILSLKPLAVVLTGGEPLISPYFKTAMKLLSGKVGIIIDTNGYLWTEDHINLFKEHNAVVRVSVDSQVPRINEKYRPVKNSNKGQNISAKKAFELINLR